jgi:hypothetical protein
LEVYRSMRKANDGLPLATPTARGLGVRPDIDIAVDDDGLVRDGFGGLSVSPDDLQRLPRHRRPPEHGGTGDDPVWKLDLNDLPGRLIYREDETNPGKHGFLEPSESMYLHEYEEAIVDTRGSWEHC